MQELEQKFNWIEMKKITKGMSGDIKYLTRDNTGKLFLLRTNDVSEYDLKKHEYKLVQSWNQIGIPMPKAIDFGTCNHGKTVYTVLEWIEGEEVEKILPKLSVREQYELGIIWQCAV